MASAPNLQLGSRQWRDFFANTSGWQNISIAPSRTRRVFDPCQRPTQPSVVLLAPGEYCGPLHIYGNQPVIIRPSHLGESAKVVIRCPEPDRTSRRVRYVGDDSVGSGSAEDALPLEPAIICSNGAQVFIEGIHIHGRVEVTDNASCEFLDCFVKLTPHVASAAAQTDNQQQQGNNNNNDQNKSQSRSRSYYAKYANNNNNNNSSSVVKQNLPPSMTTETLNKTVAAISVLGGNIWASNVVFDVVVPNGIGLLASSFIDTSNTSSVLASKQQQQQEDEYMLDDEGNTLVDLFGGSKILQRSGKNENRNSVIHLQACVVRRSAFGFVFAGGKSFAPRVENNRIVSCSHAGIVCGGASRGSIRSNHISTCDKFGLVFEGSAAPWLHQNIIEENGICGVVVRDTASPTLVRNTLLANGTCQLFCCDVATCRAQSNHFSGETINGQAPSAAGVSSFSARSILAAPKGDVYGCCFSDNSNGVLENCVIESADSCVVSSTGATVKCYKCSLQPIGEEQQQVQKEEESSGGEDHQHQDSNNNADAGQQNEDRQQQQQYTQRNTTNAALQKAFVKATFADLTTDGCVVAGVKTVEVRALEDFPDVEAVVEEIPKHLFPSATNFLKQVLNTIKNNNNQESHQRPMSAITSATSNNAGGCVSSDAAVRMSLSFTPRRPGTAGSSGNNNIHHHANSSSNNVLMSSASSSGGSFRRRQGGSGSTPQAHHYNNNNNSFRQDASYLSVTSPHHQSQNDNSMMDEGNNNNNTNNASSASSSYYRRPPSSQFAKGAGTSAARLNRIAPPEEKLDYHTLKDKKQIYALQVEVKRLRRHLYPPSHGPGSKNPMNHYHSDKNNSNKSKSNNNADSNNTNNAADNDGNEKPHHHNLGYHQWNNDKLKDFYAGKATLAEVRSERKLIPGTDATLGERLHDRWLMHKKEEFRHETEEEEYHRQEVRGRSLSKKAQEDLGRRLHNEVVERFERDKKELERLENERYRKKTPRSRSANNKKKGGGVKFADEEGGAGIDDDENEDGTVGNKSHRTTAEDEERERCARISESLKTYEENKKRRMELLEEKYLLRPSKENQVHAGKVYPRKQIEAYCKSLHRSHRDEALAKEASDPAFFEFARAQHQKDLVKQEKYLSACRAVSPKRSRNQIKLYSDSLYKGHKDLGAKEKAMAAVAGEDDEDDE